MTTNWRRWRYLMGWLAVLAGSGCYTAPTESNCTDGDVLQRPCGVCGLRAARCTDGQFGDFGACEARAACAALPDAGSPDAGAPDAGAPGPSTPCLAGDVLTRLCGNCGQQEAHCTNAAWGSFSACTGQGECAAGAVDTEACGTDVGACSAGARTRSCSTTCAWQPFGACGGSFVGPQPERCGDTLDNDCNGLADEGCACTPASPGAGGAISLPGTIARLIADPARCYVYALNTGNPSELVVINTATKQELTRVQLPQATTDFDLSPDGGLLVFAHDAVNQISWVEPGLWSVGTVSAASDPYSIEVNEQGTVYYVERDQWTDIRRLSVTAPTPNDTQLASWSVYAGDAELSEDGAFLYVGESGLSGSTLYKYNVSGGAATEVDRSTWDDGYGFPYPARQLYLAPSGRHVYYAHAQLDAQNLALVRGQTGEAVFAEDRAGTFSIGAGHVFDAELVRAVATFPQTVGAAALSAADHELWYYTPQTGQLHWSNVADFIDGVPLGQRSPPPGPLANYRLSRLVTDPTRSERVYGLDATRESVIAIDTASRTVLAEWVVGAHPTDLAVALNGQYLWVGHLGALALARIDLSTLQFDRFVPTARVPFDVEALTGGMVAVIDDNQWTTPTLLDGATGTQLAERSWGAYAGQLGTTATGDVLYVAESGLSGSNATKYDVSSGQLASVSETTYANGYGFPYPSRGLAVTPNGEGFFYASYFIDGSDLSVLRYQQPAKVLSVTPDSRLAVSATQVFYVADGGLAGSLPVSAPVQTVSNDGQTLWVATDGGVAAIDLSSF